MLLVASGARGTLMLVSTIAAWIGFMAVIFYQPLVVQPRAMRRRHAMEARPDPAAAATTRRRDRSTRSIGGHIGFVSGHRQERVVGKREYKAEVYGGFAGT